MRTGTLTGVDKRGKLRERQAPLTSVTSVDKFGRGEQRSAVLADLFQAAANVDDTFLVSFVTRMFLAHVRTHC